VQKPLGFVKQSSSKAKGKSLKGSDVENVPLFYESNTANELEPSQQATDAPEQASSSGSVRPYLHFNFSGIQAEIQNPSHGSDLNPMLIDGEHPGVAVRETRPYEMQQNLFKRKLAVLALKVDSAKRRPLSNYEWRSDATVASILGKNTKLASKFQHLLSCRPPD
jgi:hypothetical protein